MLALLGACFASVAWSQERLVACVEDANYPPFTYFVATAGTTGREARGATVDYVAALGTALGVQFELRPLPQGRCLLDLENGSVDIGLDFFLEAERAARYDVSRPYYSLRPRYFYDRQRFPDGFPVADREALRQHPGCGLRNYSYEHYGLAGAPAFDTGAASHEVLVKKLLSGRCDYFVEELEIIEGYALLGRDDIARNPRIGSGALPDAQAPHLLFLVSRRSARAQALRARIDAFIAARPMRLPPSPAPRMTNS